MTGHQSVDTTVYTIFAGMLPTLGFKKGDFEVDRKKAGKAYRTASGAIKYSGSYVHTSGGYSSGLGSIIGPKGDLLRGRLRGSVAWFEYSTTIRAIHQELLYTRGGDETKEEHRRLTQYAEDFYAGRGAGMMKQKSLIKDILVDLGVDAVKPTGEEAQGQRGATAEEQPGMGSMATARGGWEQRHPDDDALRAAGGLVGQANAIDVYMRGRDGNIYRLDVSKQTMGETKAHHGLTDLADREQKNVTSDQLIETIERPEESGGGPQKAQDDLYNYFVNTQKGWNEVIKRLKVYVTSRGVSLDNLDLNDTQQLDAIREDLRAAQKQPGAGPRGGTVAATPESQRRDILSQVRQKTSISKRRLTAVGVQSVNFQNRSEALKSALSFALHMLGNITEFMDHRRGDPGYSTEYKISGNWVAEVKHKIFASGTQVMEFMPLVHNESVLIHNAASLVEVYQRALWTVSGAAADAMVKLQARQQNADHASTVINQGRTAVEIGAIVDAGYMNLEHAAYMPTMSARAVILPEDMNKHIDKWIRESGTGRGWKGKVDAMLRKHIIKGRPLVERDVSGVASMRQGQQTPVTDTIESRLVGSGILGENFFALRGHGRLPLIQPDAGNPMYLAHAQGDVEYQNKLFLGFNPDETDPYGIAMRSRPFNDQRYALLEEQTRLKMGQGRKGWKEMKRYLTATIPDPELSNVFPTGPGFGETAGGIKPNLATRMSGADMGRGSEKAQRWKDRVQGQMGAQGAGFWGLEDYLTSDQQSGWADNVTPYFWAVPYFSILYPSAQVEVTGTD